MIHPDTQRLSTTPWFTWHSTECEQHVAKYGDRDYSEYLDSGNWCDRVLYIIPVSPMFTNQASQFSDDFVYGIPPEVLQSIRDRDTYLLWDMSPEIYSPDLMQKLWVRDYPWALRAQQFIENTLIKYNIPKDHTGLLTGNAQWQQVHSPWYETLTLHWHEQIWNPDWDANYNRLNILKYQSRDTRPNKFICNMGLVRDHKFELAHHLSETQTQTSGIVSLTGHPTEIERLSKEISDGDTLGLPWSSDLPDYDHWHQNPEQVLSANRNHWSYNSDLITDLLSSSVEFVVDTIMQDTDLTLNFNQTGDRPFRSFVTGKPFIYAGVYQGISYLRELGYKTFHEFWDESYDLLPDWRDRMHEVKRNWDRITRASHKELAMLTSQMTDILEHNLQCYSDNYSEHRHLRHLRSERYL